MSNVLRLAIVDPSDSSRSAIKNMLMGMEVVWLEAECSRYEFFADVIGQTKPDIGVIAIDENQPRSVVRKRTLTHTIKDLAFCQFDGT